MIPVVAISEKKMCMWVVSITIYYVLLMVNNVYKREGEREYSHHFNINFSLYMSSGMSTCYYQGGYW